MGNYNLEEILDFDKIRDLFKHFHITTGLDAALFDGAGRLILCDKSCAVCAAAANQKKCRDNIKYGGEKSFELGEPYIFACGCGLIMCSSPIVFNDELIGSIVCGPVMLWEADDYAYREFGKNTADMNLSCQVDLKNIRQLGCTNLTSAARILFILVDYICKTQQENMRRKIEASRQKSKILKTIEIDAPQKVSFKSYPLEYEKKLIAYVQLGEKNKAREIINDYLGEMFFYADGDLDIIKARLYEFIAFLSRAAVEAGATLNSMLGSIKNSARLFAENADFSEVCSITIEILYDFIDKVYGAKKSKAANRHLRNAVEYINAHYGENLTLENLSKAIFVSAYYLSHLFREELNTTFSDYLNDVRIRQAKKMLSEKDVKIEELSFAVGFNNPNYFTKIFKKICGVSPSQYKKLSGHN
jgi:two-component system response regulator YesN